MPVFKERVRILWSNIIRARHAIQLIFGYEPDVDGWDQKPFHMNEAGSKYQKTLSWCGGEVELKEGHSATRERWTACTYTTSSVERALQIPPLELMFKGGPRVAATLEDFLHNLRASGGFGNLRWLSVVTGESGSYKVDDVLAYLHTHLEPWGPARRWRILTADDYKCHKDPRVFELCWSRGYFLVLLGGGITGAVQICDTHLHLPLSLKYQNAEMAFLAELMDLDPAGLPLMNRCDCVRELIAIYGNPALHAKVARAGTRDNMFTLPLNGTGKHLANRVLRELWDDMHMDEWTRHIVADLDRTHAERPLEWTLDFASGLLEPIPKRCTLDTYEEFMDDEGELVDPAAGRPLWDDNAGVDWVPSPDVSDVGDDDGDDGDDDGVDGDDGDDDDAPAGNAILAPAGQAAESSEAAASSPAGQAAGQALVAAAVEDDLVAPAGIVLAPASQAAVADEAAAAVEERALAISVEIAKLDAMNEQAQALGDPSILAAVRRARGDANKRLIGKGQEDALVAQAVGQIAERREDDRRAKRARHQAFMDLHKRVEDDRARTQAIREQVLEEKRKVSETLRKNARQKEMDDAEIRLNAAEFSTRLSGKARSRHFRWRSFQRILELAGPLAPDLANTIQNDWDDWDKAGQLKLPLGDDYANKYLFFMKRRLEEIRADNPEAVHTWWVAQRRLLVAQPHLTLPPAPSSSARASGPRTG